MDMRDGEEKFSPETYCKAKYERMVQEMFEKHQSVQNVGFNSGAYKPGLDKMLAFDEALGFPSRRFESIHVAGTNGKGSVCHMLAAALSSGQAVGLYTSPHLVDFRERVRTVRPAGVDLIPEEAVYEFLIDNSDLIDSLGLSCNASIIGYLSNKTETSYSFTSPSRNVMRKAVPGRYSMDDAL